MMKIDGLITVVVCLVVLFLTQCVNTPTAIDDRGVHTPDSTIVTLDATNFDSLVSVAGRIVMVDFFSPVCQSCRSMDDTVAAMAKRYIGQAVIGKVNVDEDDSLTNIHNIESIPTFIFYNGGTEYERIIGSVEQDSLAAALERGLAIKKL